LLDQSKKNAHHLVNPSKSTNDLGKTRSPNTMKYIAQVTSAGCIAAILFVISPSASAFRQKASPTPTVSPTAKATASASANAERAIPFHGMISAVDTRAKTFTIAGKEKARVFKITDKTALTKAGNPATMKDVVEKEEARGSYWKRADGSLEARSVKLGPLTEKEKADEEARKAKRAERKAAKEEEASSASPAASASPSASPKP
jgi:hypothetical protein